ncbi:MAG TPA: branched-chain amino acid ABC transporter permease/ATP-binding protein [Solirubrobacteraceae bacterium]|nr:branched-chain amino acid ABC transporter permease/ATP-binding protein [Solirubrobacteraceae bacterium]
MNSVIVFAILGASAGAIYALGSLGIVLTFRGSGVINFASGAMGMVGAFVFYLLRDQHSVPSAIAAIAGVAAAAVLGYVTHLLMAPLKAASNLTRIVVTLALMVLLVGLVGLEYPAGNSYTDTSLLPTSPVSFLGVRVGANQLLVIVVAAIIAAAAGAVYRWTRFGLATSAVAEDGDALATLGWSPGALAAANWALGAALSGLAAILLSPITGLSVGLATSLLMPALAAAILGNLTSFPIAFLGAVAIGIAQSELNQYVNVQGIGDAVPFFAVLVFIVARGRALPVRGHVMERLPRVTVGEIPRIRAVVAVAIAIVLIVVVLPPTWVNALTFTMIGAVVLLSIVVLTGFAGQISLAQWAIAGCGAMCMAKLVVAGAPYWLAMLAGIAVCLPIGLVVGAAALRARGMSLAIATLAFGICVVDLVLSNNDLNGGAAGLSIGFFHLFGLDLDSTIFPRRYAVFVLVVFVILALGIANLRRGRTGRRLLAIRANERAAAALGVNVLGSKIAAFSYAAMIAGLGGILTTLYFPSALFSGYDAMTSITLMSNAVIGGVGFLLGPIVGGAGQNGGLGYQLLNTISSSAVTDLSLVFAALTLIVLIQAPDGLVPLQARDLRRLAGAILKRTILMPRPAVELAPETTVTPRERTTTLRADGVTVEFGGVRALDDVSFELHSGEVLGVIGPNGAGKSTLVDAVTGFVAPLEGSIRLDGTELRRLGATARARLGLGRAFQSLELFEDMTVHENLLVADDPGGVRPWFSDVVRPGRARLGPAATQAVHDLGLADVLQAYPGELSYGRRRLLAIARAVAADPTALLLDEPAAGLDERERADLATLITRLAHDRGLAVLLIEHDVNLVSSVSDRMLALDFGRVIAAGSPASVRDDPGVRSAYLGLPSEEAADEKTVIPGLDTDQPGVAHAKAEG